MKYTFKRDGIEEEVSAEKWIWGVVYKDGTELHQFSDNGIFHQVGEIEQDKIKMAVLYELEGAGRIDIPWQDGMKIIHKYRHVVFNMATTEERKVKIYIFGWKFGDQHTFMYVLPDNRIISSPTEDVDVTKYEI